MSCELVWNIMEGMGRDLSGRWDLLDGIAVQDDLQDLFYW